MTGVSPPQALELALEHHRAGRLAEAEPIYRQLLTLEPRNPDLLHLLGVLGCDAGHAAEGLALLEASIALQPLARYWVNYSTRLLNAGRIDDGAAAAESAIRLEPANADGHYNLGVAREQQGRCEEAIALYRTALALQPGHALAALNLGNALATTGRIAEAITHYHEALGRHPQDAAIGVNLGSFYRLQGDLERAADTFRRVLEFAPENPVARNNLGLVLKDCGEIEAAIVDLRHSLALIPASAETHSNLIFSLHYLPGQCGLREELEAWDRNFAAPRAALAQPHGNVRAPERRLRIGYVSPDLRDHVVGRVFWPVFEQHDRRAVELVCYSRAKPDALTARFRARAEQWRDITGWSDERLAAQIRADAVDILVDLALHTADHQLLAFARRPAPVQVAWLGYPAATGLRTMDYWLSDPFLAAPQAYGEPPFQLPETWTVYAPPEAAPEPNPLPAASAGWITFASLNNAAKHSAATWDVWAKLLAEVGNSRLMLLARSEPHREQVRASLRQRGIDPARVIFCAYHTASPGEGPASFLRRYHAADIALDPFPYNGMTTTCDALWMGLPVVALIGDHGVSRAGFSLLSNVGLPELAAASEGEYVRIAATLARDLPRLAALRASLRQRVKESPLLDARRLARNVEAAYREMWRRWCAQAR